MHKFTIIYRLAIPGPLPHGRGSDGSANKPLPGRGDGTDQARVSDCRTFIKERPLPAPGRGTHFSLGKPGDPTGEVTNEDYTGALGEFQNGCQGTFEASRTIFGPKCENAFDVYGTTGALSWNYEQLNELRLYWPDEDGMHEGYTRLLISDRYPYQIRPVLCPATPMASASMT